MWNSSFEEDESSEEEPNVRYRPGNRWVVSFRDLVDNHIDLFWLSLTDGSVGWRRSSAVCNDDDRVVVKVAYREQEEKGSDATAR